MPESDLQKIPRCALCDIPLNQEIRSKNDPTICFECAEEKRKFSAVAHEEETIGSVPKSKKKEKKGFWGRLFKQ